MKRKEFGDLNTAKTFNIEMKLEKAEKYEFKIDNPRDSDGLDEAAEDFVERIGQDDDVFDTYNLIESFEDHHEYDEAQVMLGSYERGFDLEALCFKVSTTDYVNFTVEYELYSGRPRDAFEKNILGITKKF
jgi:hypothetical protein